MTGQVCGVRTWPALSSSVPDRQSRSHVQHALRFFLRGCRRDTGEPSYDAGRGSAEASSPPRQLRLIW